MKKNPSTFVWDYPPTTPTVLFGSASGTTTSSSNTAAATLLNQIPTAFSGGVVVHKAQLVPKPIGQASPGARPPPSTT
jgi:hypothetical protein